MFLKAILQILIIQFSQQLRYVVNVIKLSL